MVWAPKAVNALSTEFRIESFREGSVKAASFRIGGAQRRRKSHLNFIAERNPHLVPPDASVFKSYQYRREYVERLLWNYAYLNSGLTLVFNGEKIHSEDGLKDLIKQNLSAESGLSHHAPQGG